MSNFLPPKDMAVRVKVKPVKSSKVTVEKERAGPYLKMNCSVMIQSWARFWYAYSTVSAPSVWTLFVPNIYVYIYRLYSKGEHHVLSQCDCRRAHQSSAIMACPLYCPSRRASRKAVGLHERFYCHDEGQQMALSSQPI